MTSLQDDRICLTALLTALWAQIAGSPFKENRLNHLEVTALMMATGTLISSLFYENGDTGAGDVEKALTYVIIGVNGLFVLVMVILIIIEVVLYVRQKAGTVIKFVKRKFKRKPKELKNVADSPTPKSLPSSRQSSVAATPQQ